MGDAMRESYQIGFPWSAFSDPVGVVLFVHLHYGMIM